MKLQRIQTSFLLAQDKDSPEFPAAELCSKINVLQDHIEGIKQKIEEIKGSAELQQEH